MEKQNIMKLKEHICERIDRLDRSDIENPSGAEYVKNLASAYLKLCEICEMEEYSQRGYSRYMDDGRSRDAMYSGRRDAMGRYSRAYGNSYTSDNSYAGGIAYAAESPKEQLRGMMDDPNLNSAQREAIRNAMNML